VKVLLVHNFYRSAVPSGENAVFAAEEALLRSRGHDVETLTCNSDELTARGVLGCIQGAAAVPWNPWMARSIRRAVDRFRPDVVHVHNTFPMISPAIFGAVGKKAARVLTLHNYRLFCSAAIPMRDGRVCTQCIDRRTPWPALQHGCYRGSRVATLPIALSIGLHRALGTWKNNVDAFIALSNFQRTLMAASGLPAGRVHVKPNFFPGNPDVVPWSSREPYVIFAGRLSSEKGLITLLKAWRAWGVPAPELRLVGDGDLRNQLEAMAVGLPVRFLGPLNAVDTQAQIARARLLVLPSEWFEGFPMVIREAFAFGTPVAVSRIGPLPTIVQTGRSGIVFPSNNPEALGEEVRRSWEEPGLLERLGHGARGEFEAKYTEEVNHAILMSIYDKALEGPRHDLDARRHERTTMDVIGG